MLLVRDDANEVERTLHFLQEKLLLTSGTRVYDQCCGIGSLSIPLASLGHQVVGVDQCARYIERAEQAKPEAIQLQFTAADACEFVCEEPCDAVFNWWTSFGYAPTDQQNLQMLRRAYESLKPGGRFALDYLNVPGILRNFQRHVVTRRSCELGDVVLIRESEIDLSRGTMEKIWSYQLPDGTHVNRSSSVRLYMPHEICEMFSEVGFEKVELYGNIAGEALLLDSQRCIAIGQKGAS
jgi:2-polyprenyl-3-methyl-5-hydroxy-6-metoxy-1,4-benzoquinol methylase